MALTADDVLLLRCEINRVAALAAAASQATSGTVTMPDGTQVPIPVAPSPVASVDAKLPTVDGALVNAAFEAGAYVQTMWEMSTLRSLGTYQQFNVAYDALVGYLDDPSKARLHEVGPLLILLLDGVANLRGVATTCTLKATLPGLSPPDGAIAPQAAPERVPEPAPTKRLRQRRRYNKKFGAFMLGSTAASAAALSTVAVLERRQYKRHPSDSM